MSTRRGTSNSNERGSAEARRKRREWLIETYRANVDAEVIRWADGIQVLGPETVLSIADFLAVPFTVESDVPACRCYRCGDLLTVETVTVDRIIPGCKGGTYKRSNIRPACGTCNSSTGGKLASRPKKKGEKCK